MHLFKPGNDAGIWWVMEPHCCRTFLLSWWVYSTGHWSFDEVNKCKFLSQIEFDLIDVTCQSGLIAVSKPYIFHCQVVYSQNFLGMISSQLFCNIAFSEKLVLTKPTEEELSWKKNCYEIKMLSFSELSEEHTSESFWMCTQSF